MENIDYKLLASQAEAFAQGVSSREEALAALCNITALIHQQMSRISWAGFYFAKEKVLYLGPFQGKVACTPIPFGKGVCGTCAETGTSQIVKDVTQFPGHIACDSASRSELVLPMRDADGTTVGVLDLDSTELARFSEEDAKGLEGLASTAGRLTGIFMQA